MLIACQHSPTEEAGLNQLRAQKPGRKLSSKPTAANLTLTPMPTVYNGTQADEISTSRNRRAADSPVGHNPNEIPEARRDRNPYQGGGALPEYPGELGEPIGELNTSQGRNDGNANPMPNQAPAHNAAEDQMPHHAEQPIQEQNNAPRTSQQQRLGVKTTRARTKIATLNIRGGGSAATRHKWQKVNQLLRTKKIGILAVNEAHLKEEDVDALHEQFPARLHIRNNSDAEHPASKHLWHQLN